MVSDFYPPGIVIGVGRYMVCMQKVSYKSEVAGPFSRGDTVINKTFTFYGHASDAYKWLRLSTSNPCPASPLYV
jgi:hypothetical protein